MYTTSFLMRIMETHSSESISILVQVRITVKRFVNVMELFVIVPYRVRVNYSVKFSNLLTSRRLRVVVMKYISKPVEMLIAR